MALLQDFDLRLEVDHVLGAQGADPAVIRARSPKLVAAAERAMAQGFGLVEPKLHYRQFTVEGLRHDRLLLSEEGFLRGRLIADHLATASEVVVMVCTVGDSVEKLASEIMATDPVLGLAMDGVGSAAVESLANAACSHFGRVAELKGLQTTIPLSPGMIGWSVEEGQPQIFNLLPDGEADVKLTPSYLMIPRKSLSMVIGMGLDVNTQARTCDYCTMSDTCRYQQKNE